jgi:integrase
MTTHKQALAKAVTFWDAKGNSARVMTIRAEACIKIVGGLGRKLSSLSATDGTDILSGLRKAGLSRSSVINYYAAYRRMLALSGKATVDWPGAGSPARRLRTPIPEDKVQLMLGYMYSRGRCATADLLRVLLATGSRIAVEGLKLDAGHLHTDITGQAWWRVIGKGGHEREVPVKDKEAVAILKDRDRMSAFQTLSYERHRQVWHEAATALGIEGFTPHSVRHLYATQAYHQSGKNLIVTRDLLGHSDINTTAGYIGVDRAELVGAVC